ncbi:MAG TPA: TonB-dependent receptor, partial [Brevundimonas sp.]
MVGTVSALALSAGAAMAQDPGPDTVDEVVVTGIRASILESIGTKRDANAIVDVVTAEDVGKFPDKNVAEALQRVPGVVINREFGEGERVSIRGTSPNLTRTLIDGHGLATADWFILEQLSATRSFNFLMLPSEIIGQTLVYKSPMADLEEGGIGGTVDTRTRRPLDLKAFEAFGSLQGAYNENAGDIDPNGSALISWHNEDKTFGVLVAGIYQKRNIRRDGVEVLGYFDADPGAAELLAPSLIGSALFEQERVREGANFAVQWRPTDQMEFALTGLYSRFGADNFNQNFLAWGSNALGGGGTLTNTTIVDGTAVAGTITSTPGGRGAVFDAIDRDAEATTSNIALDGKFTPSDRLTLDFKVGYTQASGDTTNQPFVEFGAPAAFTYDLRGDTPQVTFLNLDPTDPTDMQFDFASLHEVTNDDDEFYGYIDGEYEVDLGPLQSIKVGLKYTDHNRDTDFQATTYGGFFLPLAATGCNGGPCGPSDFAGGLTPNDYLSDIASSGTLDSYWQVDRTKVESILYGLPAATRARVSNYPEIFSVNEKVTGGYVMGKFGGEDWRGNIGVRIVNTDQTSTGYSTSVVASPTDVSNAFGTFAPVSASRSYTDVLPSANFAFDLTDDLVLRFAAARTMARPDFTDVAPRTSLNPGSLTGVGGNPNIDPYRANQFDLSLEYYPEKGTIFSAAYYYKDIESFITDAPSLETFANETSTPNLSLCSFANVAGRPNLYNCQFTINRRANGGGARLQGLELAVQKSIWRGFGVQANYTYS